MKGREVLLGRLSGREAAALVVDGRLEDLLVDPAPGDPMPAPGAIYRAKVDRLASGGAFLRLAPDATGWLREAKGLKPGQPVLVQVISYPEPGKASPVSTRILHKARRIIHTPDSPGINVSRQIRDEAEAARLIRALERALAGRDPGGGFILRSAAEGAPEAELERETQAVLASRAEAERRGPGPASAPEGAWVAALREWTHPLPDRLAVPPGLLRAIRTGAAPGAASLLAEAGALRDRAEADADALAGIVEAVGGLRMSRAELPGGAFLFVEATRACVAVDVNTGGDFSPAAGLKATLAAIRDLPRQLRLRGLGGQVVIDPAPLARKDRRTVEESLKAALKRCPVETSFAGWTPLGMLELNRKRERRPLAEVLPPEVAP